MLSYQHAYHAGNFADVLKHVVLIQILTYLTQKDKPICYIDTHAGRGLYPLNSTEAQKNKEYLNGIFKLWNLKDPPETISDYLNIIKFFNDSEKLSHYPGSPLIASHLLRPDDRLLTFELHPQEYSYLKSTTQNDKRIKTFFADGLTESINFLPPKERRGLVLIDPSYEVKADYLNVVKTIHNMHKRFSTGCFLIWYPILNGKNNLAIENEIVKLGIKNIQLIELGIYIENKPNSMMASGVLAINPPWTLYSQMELLLPYLSKCLNCTNPGHYRNLILSKQ